MTGPLWSLPRWLTVFVLAVVAADLAAIGVAASFTTITAHDLLLFGLLLGCTALAVELTRKAGEQGGMIKDVQGVWELPVAILLPPLYALIVADRPDSADAVAGPACAPSTGGCSAARRSASPTAPRR